jgi:alanine racemase
VYSIHKISEIVSGTLKANDNDVQVEHLVYDSRRIQHPENSLFFALITSQKDGHDYVEEAYNKGVRNFIISKAPFHTLEGASFILVDDTLKALQQLAAWHRTQFNIPVIGITGSNGKTIVKEWLFQVLNEVHHIVRSPRSYNSQVGVPVSVWQMNEHHSLAIFEAGVSEPGEMQQLQSVIQPAIGLITNIGTAHDDGFKNDHELKLEEKLLLFSSARVVIGPGKWLTKNKKENWLTWGESPDNDFIVSGIQKQAGHCLFTIRFREETCNIDLPFSDDASFENAVSCCCLLLAMGYSSSFITEKIERLHAIDMRLQLKHGINNCLLVNDSYSADLTSLKIALDFLHQQAAGKTKLVILSDFAETGRSETALYKEVALLIRSYQVEHIIAVGDSIGQHLEAMDLPCSLRAYSTTEEFLLHSKTSDFFNQIILVKGARKYQFERVVQWLEKKLHQTVLDINLDALVHNFRICRKLLSPATKIMAMVKAFSYGSGGAEIANVLQYHKVDYLGVAYADEGVELIRSGVRLPIMIMNTEASSFQAIVDFNLEPVIFSFELLKNFEAYIKEQGLSAYPVHIEIETGMNRLGFQPAEVNLLAAHVSQSDYLKVQSVFSHLASSEDPAENKFTFQQAERFDAASNILAAHLNYHFIKHISNSAGIIMHPQLQYDMVRLGIILYGVESSDMPGLELQPVATLRSTIAQVKKVSMGETVSYNRSGKLQHDAVIGTVRIGYADGYSRQFSNGKGKMLVKGKLAPVIGSVCMDMTMLDLTGIEDVKEGDEVIVFGAALPVATVAGWIDTISYEVLAGISQRVRRVYFYE